MNNKLNTITDFVIDTCKIADKKDIFKEFLNENDEILSTNSWGKLVKYLGQKAFEIDDLNEAYYFTIYTAYLNTFKDALSNFEIDANNFSVPSTKIDYDYNEFILNSITTNNLKVYFDDIFKEFIKKDDKARVQKYINNNLKYNYLLVLKENSSVLQKYLNHTKSDLGILEQNNFNKNIYKNKIANEYFDVVMGDENGLTLDDLYIEPYYRVHKNCFISDDKRLDRQNTQDKYIDIEDESIHKFIDDILEDQNAHKLDLKKVNTVFIAGQPGQGKSSFTKRFIYDSINDNTVSNKEVLFIKLKNIKEPTDLLNKSLINIVKDNIFFEIDSLDDYIIVLDGLDELAMKTGLSLNDIDTICQKLSREESSKIVTTRHGYVNFDSLSDDNIAIIELKELSKLQQLNWLKKYKMTYKKIKLSNKIINKIHKDENEYILELINQPILLHMIANMDIDNIEDLNKTTLYSEFFEILIKRKWEKDTHTLSKLKGVEQEEYTKAVKDMLGELAFHIYNAEFEYIQRYEFEKLKSVKEMQELLSINNNNESLQSNLKGIMVSFYFKEVHKDENDNASTEGRNEHYAIEFLHKSLMEYMVASYIYENIKEEFLETKKKTGKYVIDNGREALEILWKLFHNKKISIEISNNLKQIIKEDAQDDRDELSKRFDKFLPYFLDKDFLYSYSIENNSPIDKSENTFFGFWSILLSLDDKNHMPQNLDIKQKLFNKININLGSYTFNVENMDLSNLDMVNMFMFYRFKNINLENSSLFNSIIWGFFSDKHEEPSSHTFHKLSSISHSSIRNINFKDCKFDNYSISSSTFGECSFENIIFNSEFQSVNIFEDCTFINCPDIDFKVLKENGVVFVNSTNDGEQIRV